MAFELTIKILDVTTAIFAIPAAIFWFWSTTVKTPDSFPIYVVEPHGPKPLVFGGRFAGVAQSEALIKLAEGLSKQSKFNKWAAIFAALSASSQVLKLPF